jgi:hypothetical protein
MQSVTADAPMKAALGQVKELAVVRDEDGTVLGFFAPVALEHAARYAEAAANIDPTLHKRRTENGPNRTTAEVLEYLKSLGPGS